MSPGGSAFSRTPGSFSSPRTRCGSAAAVDLLTRISPATAVPSIVTVSVAAGPVTISSRCEFPTRKKENVPLWMPTDIRRFAFTPSDSSRPISRSVRRMPTAARHAFAGCSSPVNSMRRASPPNFRRLPPLP